MGRSKNQGDEHLQELLGKMPGWTTTWGSTAVLLILLILLTGSWIIHYPEIVNTRLVIVTKNPPTAIVARKDGRLMKLFVRDKSLVKKGDYLAVIENPAEFDHVLKLRLLLDSTKIAKAHPDSIIDLDFGNNLILGELQFSYATFIKTYDAYRSFHQLNYSRKIIMSLNIQLIDYQNQIERQERKLALLREELKIAEIQKERNKVLYEKGIISRSVYEKFESAVIEKQVLIEEAESQINNLRLKISEIEQRKLDLELSGKGEKDKYYADLISAYQNLNSEIDKWMMNYVLKSPVDGMVTFTRYWHENQHVVAGNVVFNIVPEGASEIMGKLVIPMKSAGKVKIGQKVNVKFDSYPFTEFGMVKAEIKSISLVPEENVYLAEVIFPNGLKTTYNRTLTLKQEMTGTADIITEDLRLLERFFYPLRSFLTEKINI